MARGPSPPSKGRKQQALQKLVAREIARTVTRNPAGHIWLARHFERQNGRCAYCGIPMFLPPLRGKRPADRRASLDHVVPLVRGGADSEPTRSRPVWPEAGNGASVDFGLNGAQI